MNEAERQLMKRISNFPTRKGQGIDGGKDSREGRRMEARVARLEATAEHIQRDVSGLKLEIRDLRTSMLADFRMTWGALIAASLGLAGMMAKGFHWL
ncbi:hypothetical protein D7S89_02760 [Trinickia fusca]|uniref:DUF1640 domain-containing protein n=2 Tax=Trinickia fusca TaxID=2419777 RepID=A0A494XQB9_9BURK|nr:hypothetical protein D7S89_02760 [Trinickia fusca]